jgi:protein-disulfide isomerase
LDRTVITVKRLAFAMLALALSAPAFAEEFEVPLPPGAIKQIKENLPVCSEEAKVHFAELRHKLPAGITAMMVRVESKRPSCEGQWMAATSTSGGFFLGPIWFLEDEKDQPTIEAKLRTFGWNKLQVNMTPVVDRTLTTNHLYRAVLHQATERGSVDLEGEVDPEGTTFFLGHWAPLKNDLRQERLKAFAPIVANSPAKGAAKPEVTVIEFSDFECPSCQRAAGFMEPVMKQHGDKVRYVRYDLPLVQMHPWALSAAIAGRAVYRQKPELFWDYKKFIYEHQEALNTFTIDDQARGFAQDHDLDLKKYDADVASPELRAEVLKGIGIAFANDIRATPTYVVNGVAVDPGDGKNLEKYVADLLKK